MSLLRFIRRRARRLAAMLAAAVPLAVGGSLLAAQSAAANCCIVDGGGSPNANSIRTLYVIVYIMGLVVFVLVIGTLLVGVYRFRAKRHPVAAQVHGNTRLEIGLTAGAFGLVTIISAITFIMLPGIVNPPDSSASATKVLSASLTAPTPPNGKEVTVCVTGRQFIWRYTYGTQCNNDAWINRLPYSYQELVAPAGEVVKLVIQSSDVIHAWWVPALGGKVDAVPGFTTYTWFDSPKAGVTYRGQCAQLCGREHAFMTALVRIVTPQQYQTWLAQQSKMISQQNDQVAPLRAQLIKDGYLTSSGTF